LHYNSQALLNGTATRLCSSRVVGKERCGEVENRKRTERDRQPRGKVKGEFCTRPRLARCCFAPCAVHCTGACTLLSPAIRCHVTHIFSLRSQSSPCNAKYISDGPLHLKWRRKKWTLFKGLIFMSRTTGWVNEPSLMVFCVATCSI